MDFVQKVVEWTMVAAFCNVSAVTILVWDWITHLEDEIEYIWRRDWKMAGKPLYLVVRYSGFVFQIFDLIEVLARGSEKFCKAYFIMLPLGTAGALVVVETVLAYRMLCLYEMNKRLLITNIILFSLGAASTAAIIGYSLWGLHVVATPRVFTGCWTSPRTSVSTVLIPPLFLELWLFILALIKLYHHIKEVGGVWQKTLTLTLLKDSMNWFFIIFILLICNALNLAGYQGLIALPFLRSFVIIGGCRLVIHMRKQMFRHHSTSATDVSTAIRFGARQTEDQEPHWTKNRAISFAQQIGLPPPTAGMASMWPEDEEDSFAPGPSSAGNRDILLQHLEPDPDRSDIPDMPSDLYVSHTSSIGNLGRTGESV